jgi:SHS2 domain-containing protein
MIEFIEHTADIGIRVFADSINELFQIAGYGMFKIICENLDDVQCKESITGKISANDLNELLYLFLEKLIYEFDVKGIILKCFEIEIFENHLKYKAMGEFYNPKKHKIGTGIKSPTYHKLEIKKINNKFEAVIIFDI